MQKVEFYKLQNDGSQATILTCFFDGQKTTFSGDESLVESLKKEGIFDYSDPGNRNKKLFPSDGSKFLEQLQYNFKSGYLNASNIMND
ncbi:MAG: hypothetical protein WC310_01595 [Patescibacteria group bacterium]|jgi:hypothetical protein